MFVSLPVWILFLLSIMRSLSLDWCCTLAAHFQMPVLYIIFINLLKYHVSILKIKLPFHTVKLFLQYWHQIGIHSFIIGHKFCLSIVIIIMILMVLRLAVVFRTLITWCQGEVCSGHLSFRTWKTSRYCVKIYSGSWRVPWKGYNVFWVCGEA